MTSRSNSSSRNVALITGAAEFSGVVSDLVVELLRGNGEQVRAMVRLRDEARAKRLRQLGAEVVVGDLSSPANVVDAMRDVTRMFFNTHITLDYLQETAIVCAAARELGGLKVIVKMSQMTVSQMTLTSSEESRQHRLLWLSEQIMNWSGIPVVHVRPTVLLDNPLFTVLARRSVRDRDVLALPFGTGRTSPIAAEDVARVVAALLLNPPKAGQVYELTGPQALDIKGLAEQYSRALGRTISAEDIPYDDWVHQYLRNSGLSDLVQQHLATVARLHRENGTTAPLMMSSSSPVNPRRPSSSTSPRTRTCLPKSPAAGTFAATPHAGDARRSRRVSPHHDRCIGGVAASGFGHRHAGSGGCNRTVGRRANRPRILAIRDIWLLRLRALLARAHGDDAAYAGFRDRYRDMAKTLGFEGHIAWAEAMP